MCSVKFRGLIRFAVLVALAFVARRSAEAQAINKFPPAPAFSVSEPDHEEKRAEWFLRGRVVPGLALGKSAATLHHGAYQSKMRARAARGRVAQSGLPAGTWKPLGPAPLASDASGSGLRDYYQLAGRATAVAIDPADSTGNTVYIGGAQGGVWKSTNGATSVANDVVWTALTDDQPTLSIGAIAIQPGNSEPARSVVLAGTGEADNSADSYFGLGILRSVDGGSSWGPLIGTASGSSGEISLSGLGTTKIAFSAANVNTVVAAMADTTEGIKNGAMTSNTYRGLYTSTDAGATWTYDELFSGADEATSATSVIYNASAGLFFAALRYHGFYSSPDGIAWTRLANQPGAPGVLDANSCPQNYLTTCPIYRAEITVVSGRNEMYAWFISVDSANTPIDQGIGKV